MGYIFVKYGNGLDFEQLCKTSKNVSVNCDREKNIFPVKNLLNNMHEKGQ
jgi:hypothetical protein